MAQQRSYAQPVAAGVMDPVRAGSNQPHRQLELLLYETDAQALARHILLVTLLLDGSLPRHTRAEVFLEAHGNALLRPRTAIHIGRGDWELGRVYGFVEQGGGFIMKRARTTRACQQPCCDGSPPPPLLQVQLFSILVQLSPTSTCMSTACCVDV